MINHVFFIGQSDSLRPSPLKHQGSGPEICVRDQILQGILRVEVFVTMFETLNFILYYKMSMVKMTDHVFLCFSLLFLRSEEHRTFGAVELGAATRSTSRIWPGARTRRTPRWRAVWGVWARTDGIFGVFDV